jgi:hypothetical protein
MSPGPAPHVGRTRALKKWPRQTVRTWEALLKQGGGQSEGARSQGRRKCASGCTMLSYQIANNGAYGLWKSFITDSGRYHLRATARTSHPAVSLQVCGIIPRTVAPPKHGAGAFFASSGRRSRCSGTWPSAAFAVSCRHSQLQRTVAVAARPHSALPVAAPARSLHLARPGGDGDCAARVRRGRRRGSAAGCG